MAGAETAFQIHAEPRGAHWISWITRPGDTKPQGSVILVAANEGEARERARLWAASQA